MVFTPFHCKKLTVGAPHPLPPHALSPPPHISVPTPREALVFMIGGGNYLERETLAAWASRSQPPRQVRWALPQHTFA